MPASFSESAGAPGDRETGASGSPVVCLRGVICGQSVSVLQDHQQEEPVTAAVAVARAMRALHHGICIPDYEALLTHGYGRFLESTSIAVDVGANLGFHTRILSTYSRVIAFEPIPQQAAELRRQFADRSHVEIRQVALGRVAGEQAFHHFPFGHGMSGLRPREDQAETAEIIRVPVDTLDGQLAGLERVDYIKIDVEGGEIDCLLGGHETIMRHRPFLSVEYGRPGYAPYGNTAETLFVTAESLGYVLSDLFGNVIESSDEWEKICDLSYWDYFLVPNEKRRFWRAIFAKDVGFP